MNRASKRRIIFIGFLALEAVGCKAVPKVPELTPLKPGPDPRPLMLKRVVAKPQRGTRIGNIYGGLLHVWQGSLIWKGGRVAFDPTEYSEELHSLFETHGYEVVGDPDALFDDPSEWKAEYLIGALVKDIKMDLWYPWAGYGDYNTGSGKGYVEVEWQIYDRRSRSVQLKTTTKGSAHGVKITDVGPDEPLIQAFAAAARNLLAQAKFVDLVAPRERKPVEPMPPIAIEFVKEAPEAESPEAVLARARVSVLTIFAGEGHGSGFIISRDGYVLTNQHVVGDAKTVTAKTVTGRELLGEVIRIHRERDVALVKLEQDLYEPLALGDSSAVRPGTQVYAIGSPMAEPRGLHQSITGGIVSGFRSEDEHRFIQSDVAVNPGNSGGPLLTADGFVIGLAVMKLTSAEGIGFFVPIEDALAKLVLVGPPPKGAN